jgi:hypothetical protein
MPEVNEITIPDAADMGVAVEGSVNWWPRDTNSAVLPEFDPYNQQAYYIEIFNRGKTPFVYSAQSAKKWIKINPQKRKIKMEERLWISVDWKKAPIGIHRVPITVTSESANKIIVYAVINNPSSPKRNKVIGFIESNGYISIEAEHYSRAVEASPISWLRIPNLGRTLSSVTPIPVTTPAQSPQGGSPRLEYQIYLFNKGEVKAKTYLSPTLNFQNNSLKNRQGLRYAISFDDEQPQIVNMHENDTIPDWIYPKEWNETVGNNIKIKTTKHLIKKSGEHVLKFWMVDPGVVLQKLVIETKEISPSYLGPPESFNRTLNAEKKNLNNE